MVIRNGVAVRRQSPRRVRTWARTLIAATSLTSGAVGHHELQSSLETALGRTLGEYTIVRARINFGVAEAATGTPDPVGIGLVIVGRDAAAAGTTSLPTPRSNPHADWFMWDCVAPLAQTPESSAGVFTLLPRYMEYDVRAMRKVQERDEVPVAVVEAAVGLTITYTLQVSLLLLMA